MVEQVFYKKYLGVSTWESLKRKALRQVDWQTPRQHPVSKLTHQIAQREQEQPIWPPPPASLAQPTSFHLHHLPVQVLCVEVPFKVLFFLNLFPLSTLPPHNLEVYHQLNHMFHVEASFHRLIFARVFPHLDTKEIDSYCKIYIASNIS